MSFKDLGLSSEVLDALSDSGYSSPTPIQEKAIPYVLMGRDVLGCAQTGTGKTAGFVLPMIDVLAEGRAKARMPRSLILAPTRELAAQVGESFERYGKYHKLNKALLIGGSSMSEQEAKLDRGVDVLIATPGRLLDLFERGKILLADVKILVIDEADRMLDMGFIPDVEKIVGRLPKIRQTLFFSATMPKEIRRLADQFLMNPKEISVAPPASPAETVEQGLIRLPGHDKRKALNILLDQEDVLSALVFCNRKRDVSALNKALQKRELAAGELHGDMAQSMRMETLERFKNGEIKILVCSDVAARGLDMPKVSHVFNYDVPNHAEDYVHRIGRTGRAGRSGKAFMLATPADGKSLAAIERAMNRAIPTVELDSVRILKPEDVEGELPAPEEKFDTGADAAGQAAEAGESAQTATGQDAAEADSGKTNGGKRRRRGGRSKARKSGDQDQPAETQASEAQPAEAVSEQKSAETSEADAATAVDDAGQPQAQDEGSGGAKAKGRSRSKRGGRKTKDKASEKQADKHGEKAEAEQAAGDTDQQAEPQPVAARAATGDKGAGEKSGGGQKGGGKNAGKDKRGERVDQASNGKQSKPFGDHTPAFLLKPVPQRATA
jgi:superfamily II DNA/RNA helicase